MKSVWTDLRYGARMLIKTPVVTLVAALSLAIGISANTSMFSVVNGFMLEPLRWHDAERLVLVNEFELDKPSADFLRPLAAANYLDWREAATSFSAWEAYTTGPINLTGGGRPERLSIVDSTAGIFDLLGRQPVLGRGFDPGEGVGGAGNVVVLSHDFWVRRFASDADVLGRALQLDGRPHTVIGVLPQDFDFIPANADLYRPTDLGDRREERSERAFLSLARLEDGVGVDRAQAELSTLAHAFEEKYPETNRGYGVRVQKARDAFPGPTDTRLMYILMSVSLFVLILAGVNVANLLLARADGRQKEIALRTALGARRSRIVRQLLTESVLLAVMGGVLGTALSVWSVRSIAGSMPAELPAAFWPQLDGGVLAVTLLMSIVAGLLLGLAPALHSFGDLREALGESGRGGTASRKRQRLRSIFVVVQIGVALALLTGAGVLGDAFKALVEKNPGFVPDDLVTLQLTASEDRYPTDEQVATFYREVERELREIPSVSDVAVMSHLPRARSQTIARFTVDSAPLPEPNEEPSVFVQLVNPSYFETLQTPLVRGRELGSEDRAGSAPVVVVNESFVRRYLADKQELGERVTIYDQSREIVGVVSDALLTRIVLEEGIQPTVFAPIEQVPVRSLALALKSTRAAETMADEVRSAVWKVDPDLPVAGVQSLWNHIEVELSGPKVISQALTIFGVLGLLLSAIGTYGVIAHHVEQRRREIGIRMALGARQSQVVGWVTRQGFLLAGLGFGLGLPLAFAVLQAIRALLGETGVPLSFVAGIVALLAVVSIVASLIPAHRASRIHPSRVLQEE